MTWPDIQDPAKVVEKFTKAQIKSRFESGKQISRPKHTRGRYQWSLEWTALHEDDWALLKLAFNSDIGTSFEWTHPRSQITYTVRYAEDTLEGAFIYPCFYAVTIELEEE